MSMPRRAYLPYVQTSTASVLNDVDADGKCVLQPRGWQSAAADQLLALPPPRATVRHGTVTACVRRGLVR